MMKMLSRKRHQLLVGAFFGLVALLVGFVIWLSIPQGTVMAEALKALESDAQVAVTQAAWTEFMPAQQKEAVGFIFYPGARVRPAAYAPYAHALAEEGYLAVIVQFPLNIALLNTGAATSVIQTHPEITKWVIGGHSLGGVAAASYVADNSDRINGLVLLASYPSVDLSGRGMLRVASIYGSLDGLTQIDDIKDSADRLPADTSYVLIEGGNHAYFGWYGPQPGDNDAAISREQQQSVVVETTLDVLKAVARSA